MIYLVKIYLLSEEGYWEHADQVFFTNPEQAKRCLNEYRNAYVAALPEGETYERITENSLFDSIHGVMITLDSVETDLPIEVPKFLTDFAKGV